MRRTRIDWQRAFEAWVSCEPHERTYARIAREFGISEAAVRQRAKRDGWQQLVEHADRQARAEAAKLAIRARAERIADTIRLVDAARARYAEQLRSGAEVTGRDLAALLRIEALLEGEATDRVDIGEVARLLDRWQHAALRLIEGWREIVVRHLDDRDTLARLCADLDAAVPVFLAELEQAASSTGTGDGG